MQSKPGTYVLLLESRSAAMVEVGPYAENRSPCCHYEKPNYGSGARPQLKVRLYLRYFAVPHKVGL